ncbi:MAG: CPBP family glutamic-type intramembrane protease [Sphingobacteriales bacterium JAD_PAG50586_3]|nr:MAG: CPBP family glutamic-type intramembrane protease [Sphingobacteriales bacterium JAD_PAG50586_3]
MEEPENPLLPIPPQPQAEDSIPVPQQPEPILHSCGGIINDDDAFCPHCGKKIKSETYHSNIFLTRNMFILLGYYAFCFILWLSLEFGDIVQEPADFYGVLVVDALVTLLFAAAGILSMLPLYSLKNVKLTRLLLYSLLAVAGSFGINYITKLMNVNLFDQDIRFTPFFEQTSNPVLYMILSIAVFPAVFEEMAFRGFLYNSVQKLADDKSAIWVSSLLFAIIHFAFLSLFWLIPFAIIAANLRKKYNTLWYGMVIHFVFNLTACMIDYFDIF